MAGRSDLLVRIGADTKGLQKGVKDTRTGLQKLGDVAKSAAKVMAAAFAAATAAVVALVVKGLALGDTLAKLARNMGATAAEIAEWRHVADLAGISAEEMDKGLQRLNKSVSDAKVGLSTAARAFSDLGLSWEELESVPLSERMQIVGDRLSQVTTATDKARIAADIFGRTGLKIVGIFEQGTEAIKAQREEAHKFGTTLDANQTRVIEEAVDAQGRFKTAVQGLSLQLAATFGPAVERVANGIANIIAGFTNLVPWAVAVAEKFLNIKRSIDDLGLKDLEARERLVREQLEKQTEAIARNNAQVEQRQSISNRVSTETQRQIALVSRLEEDRRKTETELNEILAKRQEIEKEEAERSAELNADALAAEQERIEMMRETTNDRLEAIKKRFKTEAQITQEALEEDLRLLQEARDLELISTEEFFALKEQLEQAHRDRFKEGQLKELDIIRERFKTEAELIQEKFAADMEFLFQSHEAKLLSDEEFYLLREQLKKDHEDRMTALEVEAADERTEFEKANLKGKIALMSSELAQATSAVTSNSKKMFEVNKAAALAEAAVTLPSAVLKAVENAGGLPWGAIPGAITAAAGIARINEIKSASFGGGTTPSAAGTTASVGGQPVAAQSATQSDRTLTVRGVDPSQLFSGRQVVDLLNEAVEDGAKLVFQQ